MKNVFATVAVFASALVGTLAIPTPQEATNTNVLAKRDWSQSSQYDYERKAYYCKGTDLYYHHEGQSYQYGYMSEDRKPDTWGRVWYCGSDHQVKYRAHKDKYQHEYSYEKNYGWDQSSGDLWYKNDQGTSYKWEHSKHAYYCKSGDNNVYHWYGGQEYKYGSNSRDYYQDGKWNKRAMYCKSDGRVYYKKWDDNYQTEYGYQTYYYRKSGDNDLYWQDYNGQESSWSKWSTYTSSSWSDCPTYQTNWGTYWNNDSGNSYNWGCGSTSYSMPQYSMSWGSYGSSSSSYGGDSSSYGGDSSSYGSGSYGSSSYGSGSYGSSYGGDSSSYGSDSYGSSSYGGDSGSYGSGYGYSSEYQPSYTTDSYQPQYTQYSGSYGQGYQYGGDSSSYGDSSSEGYGYSSEYQPSYTTDAGTYGEGYGYTTTSEYQPSYTQESSYGSGYDSSSSSYGSGDSYGSSSNSSSSS